MFEEYFQQVSCSRLIFAKKDFTYFENFQAAFSFPLSKTSKFLSFINSKFEDQRRFGL